MVGGAFASTAPAQPPNRDLTIGALIPLSGELQAIGRTARNGITLATDEINAAGGLLGRKLVVVSGDTGTAPRTGALAARRLIADEGIVAVIGALASGVTLRIFDQVVHAARIPQISFGSTSPALTGLADDGFLFRTVPSDAFQGEALAEIATEKGYRRLGILYIDNAYGKGLADALTRAFDRVGGIVAAARAYRPGRATYRDVLGELAGSDNALVLIGYPESGMTIVREATHEPLFAGILLADGMKVPALVDAVDPAFNAPLDGTAPHADTEGVPARRYRQAYTARFGDVPPTPFHDAAYDATYLLALAIAKAGSTDGAGIRDHLREISRPPGIRILPGQYRTALALIARGKDIDYVGASGSVDIDSNGDVSGSFAHWRIEDGRIVVHKVFEPVM